MKKLLFLLTMSCILYQIISYNYSKITDCDFENNFDSCFTEAFNELSKENDDLN